MSQKRVLSFPLGDGFQNLEPFDYDGILWLELCKEHLVFLISSSLMNAVSVSKHAAGVQQFSSQKIILLYIVVTQITKYK